MQSFRQYSSNSSSQPSSHQVRQQLEHSWKAPSASAAMSAQFARWLTLAGQHLVDFLTGAQQLRIWTQDTKEGQVWCLYDPSQDLLRRYSSEQELRIWLEQRHRQ